MAKGSTSFSTHQSFRVPAANFRFGFGIPEPKNEVYNPGGDWYGGGTQVLSTMFPPNLHFQMILMVNLGGQDLYFSSSHATYSRPNRPFFSWGG